LFQKVLSSLLLCGKAAALWPFLLLPAAGTHSAHGGHRVGCNSSCPRACCKTLHRAADPASLPAGCPASAARAGFVGGIFASLLLLELKLFVLVPASEQFFLIKII